MARPMRSEQAIFDELAALCSSKGFIHAIAFLCFRDNMVPFYDELKAEDTAHMYLIFATYSYRNDDPDWPHDACAHRFCCATTRDRFQIY